MYTKSWKLSPRRLCLTVFACCCVLGLGFVGGFLFRKYIVDAAEQSVDEEFAATSLSLLDLVYSTVNETSGLLLVMASTLSVFQADMTVDEFDLFATAVRASVRLPKLLWAPLVLRDDREQWQTFISTAFNGTTGADVGILKLLSNGSLVPSPPAAEYLPVSFGVPRNALSHSLLLDLNSVPLFPELLNESIATGQPFLLPPTGCSNASQGFELVMLAPVFNSSCNFTLNPSFAYKLSCFLGATTSTWLLSDLFLPTLVAFSDKSLHMQVVDEGGNVTVFVGETSSAHEPRLLPPLTTLPFSPYSLSYQFGFGGRNFSLVVSAPREFAVRSSTRQTSDIVLVLSVVVALVVCMAACFFSVLSGLREWLQVSQLQAEAEVSLSRLAAARAAHSSVVGFICHELRNPMHVVNACSMMLCEPVGEGEGLRDRQELVQDVFNSLHQMKATVDSVLNFRSVQHGGGRSNIRMVEVESTVWGAINAARGGVSPSLQYRYQLRSLPEQAMLDTSMLAQIVTAGVGFAVKHTRAGSVSVFSCALTMGGQRFLVVDVCFTCGGYKGDRTGVFVPFRQLGSLDSWCTAAVPVAHQKLCRSVWLEATALMAQGVFAEVPRPDDHTVLGDVTAANSSELDLPLARANAAAMGGWVGLEDDSNRVTHLWCVVSAKEPDEVLLKVWQPAPEPPQPFPLPPSSPSPLPTPLPDPISAPGPVIEPSESFAHMRCCVVDDELANRRVALRYLKKLGIVSVVELVNGQEALQFIERGVAIDFMLMDIEMPIFRGDEVLRRCLPPYPVFAMTGHSELSLHTEYAQAGFRSVLVKPFAIGTLRSLIIQHTQPHQAAPQE